MKNIVLCLAAVAGLAGCVVEPGALAGTDEPDRTSNVPRDVSPAALAALPRGISPEFLIKDASGCYGVALEASEPLRGVPLLNDAGLQVCDV
ncbi:hypothetical protein [Palleronia sp.]|uniref:hypothetical protein n=1 Tax=Palleronia sp. TaxID=1940284 RepID=UPI0035C7DE16